MTPGKAEIHARVPFVTSRANALTAARLLLTVPFAFVTADSGSGGATVAALVLALAIATDVLDGHVARRQGNASGSGALFDHATDCVFVTAGLAAGAARGAFPAALPALVAVAFIQYVVDSYWIHGHHALRGSRLGRYNGVLYFAPLAGDIAVRAGIGPLRPLVTGVAWLLVVSTVVSMAERVWLSVRCRRAVSGPTRDP